MTWMTSAVFYVLLQIVGGEFTVAVRSGDSFTSVGARFGVDARVLAEANGMKTSDNLRPGRILNIDNRHIVPDLDSGTAVINLPQRMLFYASADGVLSHYPVAAGKTSWKTPLGDFTILTMEKDPTWDVPPSIQEEMRRAGKPVLTHVPPSSENPLGAYWLGLSLPGIGIHGTNAPSSIFSLATHGCIRLHPDDIEDLFSRVSVGTRGKIIYEPVLIARVGSSVFLEVHPDAYRKGMDILGKALERASSNGFLDLSDLSLVKSVIEKHEGIARDVTLR